MYLQQKDYLDMDSGEIPIEVVKAIKQLKNHKAPGEDEIFPEMFKVNVDVLPSVLAKLFNKIKDSEMLPSE